MNFAVLIALSFITAVVALDMSIVNVAISHITGSFAVSPLEGIYVVTFFLIGETISVLSTGWMTEIFGKRNLLLLALFLFTITSWCCAIAGAIEVLVALRFLQGVFAGPLLPLGQSLLVQLTPPQYQKFAFMIWSAIFMTLWSLGPLIGGWIVYSYPWPWIFYINIPVGFGAFLVLLGGLPKDQTEIRKMPIDLCGLALFATGLICMELVLDRGQVWDWMRSEKVWVLSSIALILFVFFGVWERYCAHPLMRCRFRIFQNATFSMSLVVCAISISVSLASLVITPFWLQLFQNYDAYLAGLSLCPFGVGAFLGGILQVGVLYRLGGRAILVIGSLCSAFSCLFQSYTLTTEVDLWHLALSRFFLGLGISINLSCAGLLFYQDIPAEDHPYAAGIFQGVRALFGALGATLFATLWQRRTTVHHLNLIYSETHASPSTEAILTTLQSHGLSHSQALTTLNSLTDQQAAVLALNDCFLVMAIMLLLLLLIIPFVRPFFSKSETVPVG
jgi:DHA2 family multidrug resistance protein